MSVTTAPVTRRSWLRRPPTPLQLWIVLTVAVVAVVIAAPELVARLDPFRVDVGNRLNPPSSTNLFGTDDAGRDIFARMVHGARVSLGATVAVVVTAALAGTLYGALAAWVGGTVDRLLMRLVDVFLAFPYLVFAMAVAASLGRGMWATIVALMLLWWPSYARMVRGQVLSIMNDFHIVAARALGASGWQILRWHVLPHTYDQLTVRFTLDLGHALVALTGLSFLGLGAQPPSPEWGRIVADARGYAVIAPWAALFPGLVIATVVLNFMLLADVLGRGRAR